MVQEINPVEAQTLLGFALNFLVANGLAANLGVNIPMEDDDEFTAALEDFDPSETND